jgi:hypothetical protein
MKEHNLKAPYPRGEPKYHAALEPIMFHLEQAEALILKFLSTLPNSGPRVDQLEKAKVAIWKAEEAALDGFTLATHQCDNCGMLYALKDDPNVVMPLCGRNKCFGHLKPLSTIPRTANEPPPPAGNQKP